MIAGLIEPTDGRIYFDADDVTFLPPRKRNIGFVFQSPALFPHISVADNVAFGLSVKGVKKDAIASRVEEMLAMVGLSGYGGRLPAQLSGGQQQRIALARVLATDPRVLLFDEPLSALDGNLRDTLKYSILDLQRRTGKTAVYVTHDQSGRSRSPTGSSMNSGRVEQIGTQTDIYLQPQTRFVAGFIEPTTASRGTIETLDGTGGRPGDRRVGDPRASAAREGLGRRRGHRLPPPRDVRLLDDGEDGGWPNVVEGVVDRVIFEGPTAQVRVDVGGRQLRADVGGSRRLSVGEGAGRIRLGFDDLTIVPAETKP
jgi:putative spermidine/putrescine transport system ATP-binding protein